MCSRRVPARSSVNVSAPVRGSRHALWYGTQTAGIAGSVGSTPRGSRRNCRFSRSTIQVSWLVLTRSSP